MIEPYEQHEQYDQHDPAAPRRWQGGPLLLTGFEPFGESRVNPSWELVQRLAAQPGASGWLAIEQLPVVWRTAADVLHRALARYRPTAIVNVGQGDEELRLERYAHNVNRELRDNNHALPPTPHILAAGPAVYATPLELAGLLVRVQATSLPFAARISEDAGGYLCNFVSYHSYHYAAQQPQPVPVLFVHVPPVASLSAPADVARLEASLRALRLIVAVVVEAVQPPARAPH
jgi:pyroglutamyl-peptidase